MKIKDSIQKKVFTIFGGFTLLVGLSYSVASILLAFIVEDSILEKILANEARYLQQTFPSVESNVAPRVDYMTFYSSLTQVPNEIRKARLARPDETEVFTENNHHYHIVDITFKDNSAGLLVADVTEFLSVSSQPNNLLEVFVTLLAIALIFSLWLAYRITLRTTRPLSNLAKEVERQKEQNGSIDISAFNSSDEIEYLAKTIESALNKIGESLSRESDFNRDISHELRTPLTVLRNTLALSESRTFTNADRELLEKSTQKISSIIQTLLAIARAESLESSTIFLRSALEECVLSFEQKLTDAGFDIYLEVSEHYQVSGNSQLISLLFNNLIDNALNYATSPRLEIILVDNHLVFKNKFSDKLDNEKSTLLKPNVKQTNSTGFGQGLYLVDRIAQSLGWKLTIITEGNEYQLLIQLD